jgi:hypothetical protein
MWKASSNGGCMCLSPGRPSWNLKRVVSSCWFLGRFGLRKTIRSSRTNLGRSLFLSTRLSRKQIGGNLWDFCEEFLCLFGLGHLCCKCGVCIRFFLYL